MEVTGFMGGLYKIAEWITRLAVINFLWMLFTLIGLLVLGFLPATVAMFSIIRKWMMVEEDIPIIKTFWETYRKEFIKSNLLGYLLIVIGIVLFFYMNIFQESPFTILNLLLYPTLILLALFYLTLPYIFPIYVHYELKIFSIIKNSFLIMVINPFLTIAIVVESIVIYFIMIFFPAVLLFFGGSLFAFIYMKIVKVAVEKVELKKQEISEC